MFVFLVGGGGRGEDPLSNVSAGTGLPATAEMEQYFPVRQSHELLTRAVMPTLHVAYLYFRTTYLSLLWPFHCNNVEQEI